MNEDEEIDDLEVDADADSLEDDEEGRPSVILEDSENGQIIRVGRRAEEDESEWDEEEDDTEVQASTDSESEVDVPDPAGDVAVPQATAPVTGEDEPAPAETSGEVPQYNGFSLTPDGLGLYEEAYEDANSEEAERLIYGEVDEDGEVVSKGIGEREYARRCSAYEVTKLQYAQNITQQVDYTINSGLASIREEVSSLSTSLAARLKVAPEDIEGLEPFTARAFELIDNDRALRKNYYSSQGYPEATAIRLADRDVLGYKGVVTLALKAAQMEKEEEWAEIVFNAKTKAKARGESMPTAKPVEARPAPPVTSTAPTPSAAPVGPAKLTREDLRKYPRAQLEVAKALGIHPDKLN